MRIFYLIILTIFTGSVFLTSGKFVNATNTPKMYFVGVSLLLFIMMLMFKNRINFIGLYKDLFASGQGLTTSMC